MEKCYCYKITKGKQENVLSLQEVKSYLRISQNNEDEILKTIISASIDYAERFLHSHILEKSVLLQRTDLKSNQVKLPIGPAAWVQGVWINLAKISNKLPLDKYKLSDSGYLITLQNSSEIKSITIKYIVKGLDQSVIDGSIKQGLLLHISELYDERIINPKTLYSIHQMYQGYKKILV